LPGLARIFRISQDLELYALGWGQVDVQGSKDKCEYSLAAAERFLLEQRFRREALSMAVEQASQVPLSPKATARLLPPQQFSEAVIHHPTGRTAVADRHDSGYGLDEPGPVEPVPDQATDLATDDFVVPCCSLPASPVKRFHSPVKGPGPVESLDSPPHKRHSFGFPVSGANVEARLLEPTRRDTWH